MRNTLLPLAVVALVGLFAVGCAGPEQKFGRGLNNTWEIVRGGEMRRTVEQTALWDSPDEAYTTGVVRGFNRTLGRTLLGVYEIATFPLPNHAGQGDNYSAIATGTFAPNAVSPDSYKPGLIEDANFATDTRLGYSGGDVAPMIPGSRFHIFDN